MHYNLSSCFNNSFGYSLVTPPLELAVAESGCTSHFLPTTSPCNEKVSVSYGRKRVCMPNGETMVATYTALLPFPQIPLAAQKCDVFPALKQPLLSLGQFYNAGFKATFDSETVQIAKDVIETLSGKRDHRNGFYFILNQGYPTPTHSPLTTTENSVFSPITKLADTPLQAYVFTNSAYHMSTLPALVKFLHRA